ncbi:MAG TPA: DUF2231 domain-containing protein [Jatrophihabitans sp.]|nr:DUF2231 domain-containing protein [Jatrophihabitans sp.]
MNPLTRAAEHIENMKALDAPAMAVQRAARAVFGRGRVRQVLAGEPIGHPLHPALVGVPIGAWVSASLLDVTGADEDAARRLVGFGVLAAVPTAASGAHDWLATEGAERRDGFVHALLNDLALGLYVASWLARRKSRRARGAALALAGSGVLGGGAWLGGHLVYSRGVGVSGRDKLR